MPLPGRVVKIGDRVHHVQGMYACSRLAPQWARTVVELSKVRDLHRKWSRDPAYRAAHDGLDGEFTLARSLIEATARSGSPPHRVDRSNTLAGPSPVSVGRVSKPLRKDDDMLGEMLDDDPA